MHKATTKNMITYVNAQDDNARGVFAAVFGGLVAEEMHNHQEMVIVCIGTDRATGDSFGPLVGHKLAPSVLAMPSTFVYGTLEHPVHAKNIAQTMATVAATHDDPFVIGIDAGLGRAASVGYITIGKGAICPGAAFAKQLPPVGDVFVTGIVNASGAMDMVVLQNTRLGVVMKMADVVFEGMMLGLHERA